MDDLQDRYAALVAALASKAGADGSEQVAMSADALADDADSTWLRAQARALAATARVGDAGRPDLETIVDAALPQVDQSAPDRLAELLPGADRLADRLATHDAAAVVPPDALRTAGERLLDLFRRRASEDLELPADHALTLAVVDRPDDPSRSTVEPAMLILNAGVTWTVERLVHAISSDGYPGRHLTRLMRPPVPELVPSPETTIDRGLAAVGREILMADHELAHEIERIGRTVGARWNGQWIIAVGRARAALATNYAAAALAAPCRDVRQELATLGADPPTADALIATWRDPLARAHSLARAAGPPLVRGWLATTGQTIGLQRLLGERLVPAMLRAEAVDGGS